VVVTTAGGATTPTGLAIYSIRPDGSGRTLLRRLDPGVHSVIRSRDGRMIAFSNSPYPYVWYVTDISEKEEPVQIHADGYPVFSPNGTRLAMISDAGIFVVNTDDTGLHRVADFGGRPSWSPDGRRLVYQYTPAGRGMAWASEIRVVSAHGGTYRRIARGIWPAWAPRGNRIAYVGLRRGYAVPCFVNPDGSHRTCYRGFSARRGLTWSPDGKRLALEQVTPPRIAVVTAQGRHIRRFRRVPDLGSEPVFAWSPDSRWLAYLTWPPELHVLRVDRPGPDRLVTSNGSRFSEVLWGLGRISFVVYDE
jgi:Tol biopolymer transport system component